MDLTHREKFGLGSKLKRAVRKIIPNEVASVASKAAPFVAPFNPLLASGMAAVGGFDQSGSISDSLKRGILTYGGGQAARYLGGAGFQQAGLSNLGLSGFSSPIGTQTGIGKMLADRGFVGTQPFTSSGDVGLASEGSIVGASPVDSSKAFLPTDFASEALPLEQATSNLAQATGEVTKRTFTDISKDLFSGDFTKMGNAAKELGGKALKAVYTDKDGNLDKMALAGTIAAGTSYLEARKLAEDAGLVEEGEEYTEDMYNADKQVYADKYAQYLTPQAFGLKEGGRVGLKDGLNYKFMELVDEDAEEEYYKKKADELDRKYNPQNYNDIIPKEKPLDQYMLNEIMSERGMNTLSEEARDDAMKMYAERAFKKGQISEEEYKEIMGFKKGGRVGYKGGTDNPFLKIIDKVAPEEDPFQKLITKISPLFIDEKGDYREGLQKAKFALSKFLTGTGTDLDTGTEWYNKLDDETQKDIIKEKIKYRDMGYIGGTPVYDEEFAGRYGIGGNYANGGRIGYKDAGFTTVKDLGIEKEEIEPKFQYDLKDLDIERDKSKVLVMDEDGSTKIMDKEIAETLGLKIIADSFDTELMKKAKGGRVSRRFGSSDDGEKGVMSITLKSEDDGKKLTGIETLQDEDRLAVFPKDIFSANEISRLFSDKSLTTNLERKQLYKILMNPGQFPEAEMGLKKLLGRPIEEFKKGGRVQYAMGSPEQNAMAASGISGIPLNVNPAGATELDMRNTGGFVPPVGVKEKADDIPAMLSNNEFVFTADAVKAAGGGSVNKGAKKMYDLMKSLEGKVV